MPSYFVDPALDSNTGSGTFGDPFGDLQYALDNIAGSNTGNVINIKAGTAELLTGTLDFTAYGMPSFNNNPVTFAGYTATEGDGGLGEIDGNGSFAIVNDPTAEGVWFRDLVMGNCGSNNVLTLDRFGGMYRCKIYGTTANGVTGWSDGGFAEDCWFDDIGAYASTTGLQFYNCLFTEGVTNTFGSRILSSPASVVRCCFKYSGTTTAVLQSTRAIQIVQNSFLATGATAIHISTRSIRAGTIRQNLFEGGDHSVLYSASEHLAAAIKNNSFFNIANGFFGNAADLEDIHTIGHDALGSSPFAKSGSISSFADRLTYFSPNNVGDVLAGEDNVVRGAVQPASGGGGSTTHNPFRSRALAG